MRESELAVIGDVELVEELSMLTTQTARMRARMTDIMTELDRRRGGPSDRSDRHGASMYSGAQGTRPARSACPGTGRH